MCVVRYIHATVNNPTTVLTPSGLRPPGVVNFPPGCGAGTHPGCACPCSFLRPSWCVHLPSIGGQHCYDHRCRGHHDRCCRADRHRRRNDSCVPAPALAGGPFRVSSFFSVVWPDCMCVVRYIHATVNNPTTVLTPSGLRPPGVVNFPPGCGAGTHPGCACPCSFLRPSWCVYLPSIGGQHCYDHRCRGHHDRCCRADRHRRRNDSCVPAVFGADLDWTFVDRLPRLDAAHQYGMSR